MTVSDLLLGEARRAARVEAARAVLHVSFVAAAVVIIAWGVHLGKVSLGEVGVTFAILALAERPQP